MLPRFSVDGNIQDKALSCWKNTISTHDTLYIAISTTYLKEHCTITVPRWYPMPYNHKQLANIQLLA